MNVEQLMQRTVHTCRAHHTLHDAAGLMWEHDCGCLPVLDDDGKAVGMLTDRDICMAAYTRGRRRHPDDAESVMRHDQIRRLPPAPHGCDPAMLAGPDIATGGTPRPMRVAACTLLRHSA